MTKSYGMFTVPFLLASKIFKWPNHYGREGFSILLSDYTNSQIEEFVFSISDEQYSLSKKELSNFLNDNINLGNFQRQKEGVWNGEVTITFPLSICQKL